jgi:hypothetical protein
MYGIKGYHAVNSLDESMQNLAPCRISMVSRLPEAASNSYSRYCGGFNVVLEHCNTVLYRQRVILL